MDLDIVLSLLEELSNLLVNSPMFYVKKAVERGKLLLFTGSRFLPPWERVPL
jgi:hypothetical protein